MHTVHIEPHNINIMVEDGAPLKDAIGKFGIDFPCGGKGLCGNCHVELLEGCLELSERQKQMLDRKGLAGDRWRIACLCHVHGDISIRIPEREQVILSGNSPVAHKGEEGHAIAVDLGSTTIVSQLIDRMDGCVKGSVSEINIQNSYGADIISRIAYALQSNENAVKLASLVRQQTGRMVSALVEASGIRDIRKVVIVGNSVMHHLFCGLDVTPLSAYPFQSEHNGAVRFSPGELGWECLPENCRIVFMPNISHFVGSDILAGIYQLGLHRKDRYNALIDLGTNGEIVIGNRDRLLCTSTAAGPAFEGVNIINGMRAVSGAICHVNGDTGKAEVIGGVEPSGICGSGLIEAIHYRVRNGDITSDGRISNDELKELPVMGNVRLYDKDIREFQLAKAAIATGFELLAARLGIATGDIEHVFIAGGLGNYLDISKALDLGLIRGTDSTHIVKAGNSALNGCKELTSDAAEAELQEIIPLLSHYSLETDPDFQERYCMNLFF